MRVHTQEKRAQEMAASQIARQKAAAQAEIEHRSKPSRQLDDDEFRAMCGISRGPNLSNPPMRR